MKLKTKLLAGASTLAIAGGMMAAVAPVASAAPTAVGGCGGSVTLLKLAGPVKGSGLGDQTAPVKVSGNLAKDQTTKHAIAGNCAGVTKPADAHIPELGPLSTLTPISQATSLSGNASCANGPDGVATDASAAAAFPLTGKISWTFSQTYTDLANGHTKKYTMQAAISALGFNAGGPDLLDVAGIVLSGVNVGANAGGTIWEDPVSKTGGATGYNTGYELDTASAIGCTDTTPNNANITIVLSGGGGATATSLLGSSAPGIGFTFGE